jgi:hypothetical protein
MAEVMKGVIQAIETRSVAGGKTAYGIKVAGTTYGAGLYAPKAKEGDYVQFTVDDSRGYKNVERGTLKVLPNKPTDHQEAPAYNVKSYPSKQGAGGSSFDARQDAISRQAASNTALAYLTLQQAAGCLPLPSKKADIAEALDALLKETTVAFYEQNTGVTWKDIGPKKKDSGDESSGDEEESSDPADEQWD